MQRQQDANIIILQLHANKINFYYNFESTSTKVNLVFKTLNMLTLNSWFESNIKHKNTGYFAVLGSLVSPASRICGWCKLTPDLDPTLVGSHVSNCFSGMKTNGSNWFSGMKTNPILHFQTILRFTSQNPWPSFLTYGLMNMWRFLWINQVWFQSDFQLFK